MGPLWGPLDQEISPDKRAHFAVCDRALYEHMIEHTIRRGYVCSRPEGRLTSNLELHLIPPTEVVQPLSRMHQHSRRLQQDLMNLTLEFRAYRRRIGDVFEALAAAQPQLAPMLGLVNDPAAHERALQDPPNAVDDADGL